MKTLQERFDLKGRTALVTGSSRGIGRAILLGLVDCGARVIVHGSKDSEAARGTCADARARGGEVDFIASDLSSEPATRDLARKALDRHGTIDILVSNASIQFRTEWMDITTEEFDLQVKTNFHAALILTQLLVPAMQRQRWGRLLMIGSVQEALPHYAMAVYAATKSAQTSLVRNLAKQLAPDGITVNNLAPGVIDTDRNARGIQNPVVLKRILARIPADRCGQPEDCAAAAALLCSEAGSYITGTSLYIDGGMSL